MTAKARLTQSIHGPAQGSRSDESARKANTSSSDDIPIEKTSRYRKPSQALCVADTQVRMAAITGASLPGVSTGDVLRAMEGLADKELPRSMTYEWTELSYLQKQASRVEEFRDGVARAIEILRTDVVRTMRLLGCPSVRELGPSYIETATAARVASLTD